MIGQNYKFPSDNKNFSRKNVSSRYDGGGLRGFSEAHLGIICIACVNLLTRSFGFN